MQKIKAFTLFQTIVSMIIGVLVLFMGGYVYIQFMQKYWIYENKSRAYSEVVKMNTLMKKDFYCAKTIFHTDEGISFSGSENSIINYLLLDSIIIRQQQGVNDTFNAVVRDWKGYYRRQEVINAHIMDELQLVIGVKQHELSFMYYKEYDTVTNMSFEQDSLKR